MIRLLFVIAVASAIVASPPYLKDVNAGEDAPTVITVAQEKGDAGTEEPLLKMEELELGGVKEGPSADEQEQEQEKEEKEKKTPSKLIWLMSFSGYLTYSKLIESESIIGGNASALMAPSYQISDKMFFILMYNGSYQRKKQVFTEDEGPRLTSENQTHTMTPMLKYSLTPRLAITPSFFYSRTLTKETADERWYKGLYDYGDTGGGLDIAYTISATETSANVLTLGYQRYFRIYPNFHSLLSLTGIGDLEEHEKDFTADLISLNLARQKTAGMSYSLGFIGLLKDYRDKQIENEVGGRTGELQEDYNYTLSAMLGYRPNATWNYSLSATVISNRSNQNLADGTFPAITFHRDYYSSRTVILSPGISYTQRLTEGRDFTLSGTYSATKVEYKERKTKDLSGNVTDTKEVDWTHNIVLNWLYSINRRWKVGLIADLTVARSNTEDESSYLYNYEILNLSAGFSYQY